jgi:hypothetical protein
MSKIIFSNQNTDIVVAPFNIKGLLQVNISGVLDGADVITYYIGAGGVKTPIATCSWRPSLGDTLTGADGGQQTIQGLTEIGFEIQNSGALTDINLDFYCDTM